MKQKTIDEIIRKSEHGLFHVIGKYSYTMKYSPEVEKYFIVRCPVGKEKTEYFAPHPITGESEIYNYWEWYLQLEF